MELLGSFRTHKGEKINVDFCQLFGVFFCFIRDSFYFATSNFILLFLIFSSSNPSPEMRESQQP